MSTTSILNALATRLDTLGSLPVAWPGVPMTPPSSGMWLEVRYFPNEPRDLTWGNTSQQETIGFFQVSVYWRPSENDLIDASTVADSVIALFAKGTAIDAVRVRKTPWQSPSIDADGKSFIPVIIPYQGVVEVAGFSGEWVAGGSTTTDIVTDLLERLDTLTPSLPIAWPGVHKDPPSSGMWLETRFLPAEPQDLVWDNDTQKQTSGGLLVRVCYRPKNAATSQYAASEIADTIIDLFPKGLGVGAVRIRKAPFQGPAVDLKGSSFIPVIIPYLGIISVPVEITDTFYVVNNGVYVVNNGIQVINT